MTLRRLALTLILMCVVLSSVAVAQPPFSGVPTDRPSVSPYLHLLNDRANDGISNYFTFVQPQIQQRQATIRQQSQINQLQREVQNRPLSALQPRGSQQIRATGHETFYQHTSHYFPARRR